MHLEYSVPNDFIASQQSKILQALAGIAPALPEAVDTRLIILFDIQETAHTGCLRLTLHIDEPTDVHPIY